MARQAHGKLWRFTRRVFLRVRAVSLVVLLAIAYAVGVGLTRLVTLPLPKRWLGIQRQRRASYWIESETTENTLEGLKEPF